MATFIVRFKDTNPVKNLAFESSKYSNARKLHY